MSREVIFTENAPQAVGPYSQAVRCGNSVYLSGQVALDPATQALVEGDVEVQIRQVFANLAAVAEAAGGTLANVVRLGLYLTDINDFGVVNEAMQSVFSEPYPARSTIGVASLPKGARVEADAILVID